MTQILPHTINRYQTVARAIIAERREQDRREVIKQCVLDYYALGERRKIERRQAVNNWERRFHLAAGRLQNG